MHGSLLYLHIHDTTAVCMYLYNMYGHQPGKVANPARGQLAEQGKWILPCPRSRLRIWSRESGSAVPSRVSLLISILRLNLVLNYGIPPSSAAASIHYRYRLSVVMYYGCSSTYMWILCTMISAALLSFSASSTNECPRIK